MIFRVIMMESIYFFGGMSCSVSGMAKKTHNERAPYLRDIAKALREKPGPGCNRKSQF